MTCINRTFDGAKSVARGLPEGRRETLKALNLRTKRPVRLLIVGHTHEARLVVEDGLSILDCGAWLERCKVSGAEVPSCKIGAVGQTEEGVDVRIYQLTPRQR